MSAAIGQADTEWKMVRVTEQVHGQLARLAGQLARGRGRGTSMNDVVEVLLADRAHLLTMLAREEL